MTILVKSTNRNRGNSGGTGSKRPTHSQTTEKRRPLLATSLHLSNLSKRQIESGDSRTSPSSVKCSKCMRVSRFCTRFSVGIEIPPVKAGYKMKIKFDLNSFLQVTHSLVIVLSNWIKRWILNKSNEKIIFVEVESVVNDGFFGSERGLSQFYSG